MYNEEMLQLKIRSSLDGTEQPSLFYQAKGTEKRPLLVGFHTWSWDRFNQIDNMLPYAQKYNFNLLLPEFRGPNMKVNPAGIVSSDCTKACGSEYAKQDVFDAIDYVQQYFEIDEQNIFALGLSGGGHMALLCGAKEPKKFKAIGAFVPVCDLERWTKENVGYAPYVQACCEGDLQEMKKRSPISYAKELSLTNLKIFHGKFDAVVPYKQSFDLYQEIMKIAPAARVFLDIFDGGHEICMKTAFDWLLSQYNGQKLTGVTD